MTWSRIILNSLLIVLIASHAGAQYREESGALEQIYESRVRGALNTIMRPGEFSVVVSVDINRDPKQLNALEEEMDKMSLPGMVGLGMAENMNVSNKLHQLRNQVSAQLILDNSVSKEKEAAARALAAVKLHLDESAGDSITVIRANLMPQDISASAELLPELSWRMWLLVLLMSLLSLGFLFMALQRRKNARKEAEKSQAKPEAQEAKNEEENKEIKENIEDAKETVAEDKELIELYERKKSLAAMASRYPEAASRALDEQFEKGHQQELMLVCESFGWESSKELLPGLSHRTWGRLGSMMMVQDIKVTPTQTLAAVAFCHKAVISKYLELADGDLKNPFAFLLRLLPEDRNRILNDEVPRNIAQICAYLDSRQKAELLESLAEERQQATLLEMARIREVPFDAIQKISESLRKKADQLKEKPIVSVDGQNFLVQLLEELDVVAEIKFLDRLRREDAATMENLRRAYLQFEDLVRLPQEVLSAAFGNLDVQVLTMAFAEADAETSFYCFKALPEKRAKMVEKDLSYSKGFSQKQILGARRTLLKSVRSILLIEGRDPGFYLGTNLSLVKESENASVA